MKAKSIYFETERSGLVTDLKVKDGTTKVGKDKVFAVNEAKPYIIKMPMIYDNWLPFMIGIVMSQVMMMLLALMFNQITTVMLLLLPLIVQCAFMVVGMIKQQKPFYFLKHDVDNAIDIDFNAKEFRQTVPTTPETHKALIENSTLVTLMSLTGLKKKEMLMWLIIGFIMGMLFGIVIAPHLNAAVASASGTPAK